MVEVEAKFSKAGVLFGVNGVGKNAILETAIAKKPEKIIPFHGSARLMRFLNIEQGDYNALRAVPEEQAIEAFDRVMGEVLKQRSVESREVMMLNIHLFNIRKGVMLDRSQSSWYPDLDAIVVVTTDRQTLMKRISDDERDRDLFLPDSTEQEKLGQLDVYLEKTLSRARAISDLHNIPFYEIPNPKGELDQAVDKLLTIVEDLSSGNTKERI